MDITELTRLIKTRRSIRLFQDKPVPEALLLQAVETATWAPNGSNSQNWRFFIILDKKVINSISDAIQANMKTIMSWPEMANAGPTGGRQVNLQSGDPLGTAPVLIVVATIRPSNPMVEAMAKRARTDPKAKEMFEGHQNCRGMDPVNLSSDRLSDAGITSDGTWVAVDGRSPACQNSDRKDTQYTSGYACGHTRAGRLSG